MGDYRGYESLVIRLLHNEDRELRFWFDQLQELEEKVSKRGLYLFAGPVGSGEDDTDACPSQEEIFGATSHVD